MKQIKFLTLSMFLALVMVSCDKDSNSNADLLTRQENVYEKITNDYLASVKSEIQAGDKTTHGFWGRLWRRVKQVGRADGKGAEKGFYSGGLEGALYGGVFSSIIEIFEPLEPISGGYGVPADDFGYGLPDISIIEEVAYPNNKFDLEGYNHYVVINKLMNNAEYFKNISNQQELYAVFGHHINEELAMLYPEYQFSNYEDFMELIQTTRLQPGESYTEGTAYYDRVFPFNGNGSDPNFIQISQLYQLAYEATTEEALNGFIEYSKNIENQVIMDSALDERAKDCLLIEMATLRHGIKYYYLAQQQ